MSETQEIEVKELTETEIRKIVEDILNNPQKYEYEAKFILRLRTDFRRGGCGWVYLYEYSYKVLYGNVDEVLIYRSEFNCDVNEYRILIPKTVPTVVLYKYHDDDPDVRDHVVIYVFTGSEWKSVEFNIPK
jgi:hypothetical protein